MSKSHISIGLGLEPLPRFTQQIIRVQRVSIAQETNLKALKTIWQYTGPGPNDCQCPSTASWQRASY